ncbi:ABC transporter G family member 23 [Magnolia sinica]|uniref:ABC transporter G family member 23 n=1 Tax=Magnolia sinica TaxID=86752 RepID=UPI00265952F4|nr:ABC transporter G family member 23 [Magnolia sinica]
MADFLHQTHLDDDSTVLYSSSGSPNESATPSSSFYQSPPPPSLQSTACSYKLSVSNLSYTIHHKRRIPAFFSNAQLHQPKPTNVLESISFVARSSEILAVVGPSGAGKSTLLRIISGRIKSAKFDPKSISLNDHPITSPTQLRRICGFVTQEDNLLPLLTVKETLMFSARFRLKGMKAIEKEERVDLLMQELGLVHVANSFIGDEETRGISGGERKRVSIGVDVIHDPPILLLDEPTSGLDSSSALQVIELLAAMAKTRQRTVVLTIHQPSYRIIQYISTFLLLSRGSVAHCGSLKSLVESITYLGFKIPVQLNALEFAMEIITSLEGSNHSQNYLSIEDSESSSSSTWLDEEEESIRHNIIDENSHFCCSWRLYEIASLCLRFWKIIYRTKQLFLARTMQAIVGGFGLGSVYLKVKDDEGGVAERLGLFAFSLSFLLSSTVEALPIFLQERRVLMREVSRGAYKVSSYMIANTIVFIPFLLAVAILFAIPVYWLVGLNPSFSAFIFFVLVVWLIVLMASSLVLFLSAVSPDFISGNSLICAVLGAFFLFSGYFIPKENIPRYWIFMYYASLYKYPLDSLLINEYWSLRGECFSWQQPDRSTCLMKGGDVLRGRGLDVDNRWMNVGVMLGFFLFYRVLCWIILARKASRTMF